ncbi:fumarylacetoacetate hydrolase family protein [Tardiphaga sp.]|uniref:fumarylacetoacetate hydrolase family protein n=1 Tax=Tardiphaga sp. TaxID=1926292 RepID=UPI0026102447|nr:fumarylacetoacetate hydrolase family protein [Tardiphaga sp.]MDB5621127.1 Tat (Twin-arginine translocation) pathway signal sequence [Tardiphaga sp.]
MDNQRRKFLTVTAASVVAGGMLAGTAREAFAQAKAAPAQPKAAPPPPGQPKLEVARNMTLAMLQTPQGLSLGVRTDKGIVNVSAAAEAFKLDAPASTDEVISGDYDAAALKGVIDKAKAAGGKYLIAEKAAIFAPCVTEPSKILCVGLNYRAHAAEANEKLPKEPILFNKYNSALNSHGGTIAVSKEPGKNFDYETELVAVIGKTTRNVSEADALGCVFGYCTGQDFSERDQQMRSGQWMLGKTGDGWGPIGPWLVTADQVDPENLNLKTLVNGEQRQSANTKDMIFSVKQIVSFASRYMTLQPGDLIFTGTPEGVIIGYPPEKRVWLKAGDKVVSSIDKLGDLEFTLT